MIRLPLGSFQLRLHVLVPVAVAGLLVPGGDLWLRYLLLLSALLLHEVAHAATALGLGARRAIVTIWPVFGRADVETFPDRREAAVALAAPATNLLAAGVCALLGGSFTWHLKTAPWLDFLCTVHLLMGIGNLIPIPPIDGGRAVRALLRPAGPR